MGFGKSSALFGFIAVIFVVIVGFSVAKDDGVSGPLVQMLWAIFGDGTNTPMKPEFRAASAYELHESSMRLLLQIAAVSSAITAGVLAAMAARDEQNSLWYAVGIFGGFTAITEISYSFAAVYALVATYYVMRNRKWKMTAA